MEPLWDALRGFSLRIRRFLAPRESERELEEEFAFHLEMEQRRLEARGIDPAEARRQAHVRFGGVDRYTEMTRDARGTRLVEDGMRDVRYGLRMLAKNPVFTAVAVITLALGIGATTAIYTVVESVLLEPLPFQEPEALVSLYSENQDQELVRYMTSPMDFDDWRTLNSTFAGMAAYWPTTGTLTENDGNPTRVKVVYTTEDFFDVLGATPLLGRLFTDGDGPGSTEVVVLSHGFWQRRYGADPSIVGQTIVLDGDPDEVVGVLRPGQSFPLEADVWINMTWPMQIQSRFARWMSAVGRLAEPTGIDPARSDMGALAAGIAEANPASNDGWTVRVEYLHDELVGDTRTALWVLLGATGLVLLIACANVANLLLSRSEVRAREMAVRTAFGAGRWRLARQLLVESLLLSAAGALLGVGLAWLGVRGLLAIAPVSLPREEAITMDGTVLLVVVALTAVTGILFGMAPILRLLSSNVQTAIREGARTTGSASGNRVQNLFVTSQFALALILVVGAGLLVRSFANVRSVDAGFAPSGVLTMELDLPTGIAPNDTAVIDFYDRLEGRIAELPGVTAVGDASSLPLGTDLDYVQPFRMDRLEDLPDQENRVAIRLVTPGFFDAMRVPVLQGRALTPDDRLGGYGVAVVNEAFVKRFFPEGDVMGATFLGINFRYGPLGAINTVDAEVVGVVKDVRYQDLRAEAQPAVYISGLQSSIRRRTLVVRTAGDETQILPAIRRELAEMSGQVALTNVRGMPDVVADAQSRDRFSALLLSLFGLVALVLAAVGVYGVLAYAVAKRTNEVGIRMALGADAPAVRALILRDGVRLVIVGLGAGLVGALAISGVLASQLYQVDPRDPAVLATVAGVLLGTGLLASLIPAWRATRVDPVVAMRAE